MKSTVTQFINIYEKLFNVIFDNGIMPSSWYECAVYFFLFTF
jgi:hypothetical protein